MRPRVLIGFSRCPLTRAAFEEAGCEAWTCDLLPAHSGDNGRHIQGDVWGVLYTGWDMAVLHPMCTYLTVSAAWAYGDGPYHQKVKPGTLVGAERRAAREAALSEFRKLLGLPFPVAIENPARSFVCSAIRPPSQVIHPWQFGDDASKATGLWLTRGLPALEIDPGAAFQPRYVCADCGHTMHGYSGACGKCAGARVRERWSNQTDSGQNRLTPGDNRWLERSATYPGIAAAIGGQFGHWLNTITTRSTP